MFGLIEIEVCKDRFIKIENLCGFYSKIEGETATHGFGFSKNGLDIKGRIIDGK